MNKYLYALIFVFVFYNISYSQSYDDFNYVTTSTKGTEFYVYIEKNTNYSKEVWVKFINPTKTIKNKKGKYVKVGGDFNVTFYTIYCSTKKYDSSKTVSYNKNGDITYSGDLQNYGERIIPGSVLSSIYDFVCNNQKEIYEDNTSQYSSDESNYNGPFKFVTTFNSPPFEIPLRKVPNFNSEIVYKCPKDSFIYVIDNSKSDFYKVSVNGNIGYLTTGFLLRKF